MHPLSAPFSPRGCFRPRVLRVLVAVLLPVLLLGQAPAPAVPRPFPPSLAPEVADIAAEWLDRVVRPGK
jgi:hypothetical protein